jgi:hypothetical protein
MKKLLLILVSFALILALTSCEFIDNLIKDNEQDPPTEDTFEEGQTEEGEKEEEKEEAEEENEEVEEEKTPTEGIKYELSKDGEYATAVGYEGTDTELHFLKEYEGVPVTKIGFEAFKGNTTITSVTIHNGIKEIDAHAFRDCTALTSLSFQKNSTLEIIGYYSFSNCAIQTVKIPESVQKIDGLAFNGCLELNDITVPSHTVLGDQAFMYTGYANNEANWEDGVLYLGTHFLKAKLEYKGDIIIKEGTTTIAGFAFGYCRGIDEIVIPDSVVAIGDLAFYEASLDETLILPKNLKYIGNWAFYSFAVSYIYIPNNIEFIGGAAFNDIAIFGVYFGGTEADWNEMDNIDRGEFNRADIYYYSESSPTTEGYFWHYDENGNIVIWR